MLVAVYSPPSVGKPTVIMLHGLASNKAEWQPLIDACASKGIGALAYDSRPPGTPWSKLVDDLGAVLRDLETHHHVDRKTVILAGASLGANVCLKYAALTANGKAVLLLSPGLDYQGLTTADALPKVKVPVLIVAHPADAYAYKSSMQLTPLASDAQFWTSKKPGHGAQMFEPDLLGRLCQWFEKLR